MASSSSPDLRLNTVVVISPSTITITGTIASINSLNVIPALLFFLSAATCLAFFLTSASSSFFFALISFTFFLFSALISSTFSVLSALVCIFPIIRPPFPLIKLFTRTFSCSYCSLNYTLLHQF